MRWCVVLASTIAVGSAAGCSAPCEDGFAEVNGNCIAFPRGDAGELADGGAAAPDGGVGETDAGSTPDDAGEAPFDGGTPVDAGGGGGTTGALLLRGRAVLPMTDDDTVLSPGEVLVDDDGRIACVGLEGACADLAGGATIVDSGGVILPGLVDAHNHVAYDFLPEWASGLVFDDSGQWRDHPEYETFITPYRENKGDRDAFCAMVQWGEMMALTNGVTTIFGAPQPRTCFRWLVRNPELSTGYNGFAADRMRTNTLGISTVNEEDAADLRADMDAGDVTAYVVHLAEGLSTRAREEFLEMRALGLLRSEAVLIHATALTPSDFDQVAAAGAHVVWSPSSNLALYQDTTDVRAAVEAGVSVSIAPDWTPSGTDSMLTELRYARDYVDRTWPELFSAGEYVGMATRVPARQLGLSREIGTLEVGLHADLLVVEGDAMTPFEHVIAARPEDIRLVVLGGVPSYGRADLVNAAPNTPEACHAIDACGQARVACWGDTPEGPVSPTSVAGVIQSFHSPGPEPFFDCD